jgi:hypothetical protein
MQDSGLFFLATRIAWAPPLRMLTASAGCRTHGLRTWATAVSKLLLRALTASKAQATAAAAELLYARL